MAIAWKKLAYADDLHAALTIDGTSPLSLSGQAISIKNDAAGAITEVDTGTLDNSATKIPANLSVYNAIGAKHVHNLTVTVKAAGGDFTTIQGAINYFQGKTVTGDNYIQIDPGTYDEHLNIANINLAGTLIIQGDTRVLAGLYYVNGVVNYHTLTNAGSGTFTITRGGAGNTVLTVAGSTGNPDFDADGWASGDKVLVYTGTTPNTIAEMTLTGVSNNTLTASGAWADPGAGTSGAGYTIVLQPNVQIAPSSPSTQLLNVSAQKIVRIIGLYLYHNTASYMPLNIGGGSVVQYRGVVTRGGYYSVALSNSELTPAASGYRITFMDSASGVSAQNGSIASIHYSSLVKVNTNYGFFAGYNALMWCTYCIAIKCPVGYYAYGMSLIYAVYSQTIGCVATHSPTTNTVGNANSYVAT